MCREYIKVTFEMRQLKYMLCFFQRVMCLGKEAFSNYQSLPQPSCEDLKPHSNYAGLFSRHSEDEGTCFALITNSLGQISAFTAARPTIIISGLREPSSLMSADCCNGQAAMCCKSFRLELENGGEADVSYILIQVGFA